MKWRWLEKAWGLDHPEWIDTAKINFTRLSQRYQCARSSASPRAPGGARKAADSDDDISDDEEEHVAGTIEQQLAQYYTERRIKSLSRKDSPIPYWLQQRGRWPQLAALALDSFSTPVMSDEPGRVFSEARAMIGTRRRLLGEGTVEHLICMKSWIWTGIITWGRY